jgi:hypothetical protein
VISLARVRKIASKLPGSEEGPCYGTPGFRVRKKLTARVLEAGESGVLKIDFETREVLTQASPKCFSVTPHCRGHPMMIVNLQNVEVGELEALLEGAWRFCAPKRLIADYDS